MQDGCQRIPDHTHLVRAIVVAIALVVGLVLIARGSTGKMLEEVVVQPEATVILTVIAGKLGDTCLLEGLVRDAVGIQCRVLRAVEIVDHVAAVLAAVEETRPYEVHHSGYEQGIVTGIDTGAIGILEQGLQFGHVTRQAIEGEDGATVHLIIAHEPIVGERHGVNQRHLLYRQAISRDLRDMVNLIRHLCWDATLCQTAILQIEAGSLGDTACGGTEPHRISLARGGQRAVGLEVEVLVLGVAVGVVVLHTCRDAGLTRTIGDDGHVKLHAEILLGCLCEACHGERSHSKEDKYLFHNLVVFNWFCV